MGSSSDPPGAAGAVHDPAAAAPPAPAAAAPDPANALHGRLETPRPDFVPEDWSGAGGPPSVAPVRQLS